MSDPRDHPPPETPELSEAERQETQAQRNTGPDLESIQQRLAALESEHREAADERRFNRRLSLASALGAVLSAVAAVAAAYFTHQQVVQSARDEGLARISKAQEHVARAQEIVVPADDRAVVDLFSFSLTPFLTDAYAQEGFCNLSHLDHQRIALATERLLEAVRIAPTYEKPYKLLRSLGRATNDYSRFPTTDDEEILSNPSLAAILIGADIDRGELEVASEKFAKASVRYPQDPDLIREEARILAAKGNKDQALGRIEESLRLDPFDPDSQVVLFGITLDLKGQEAAEGVLTRWAAVERHSATPWLMLSAFGLQARTFDKAYEYADVAKARDGSDPLTRLVHGFSALLSGRPRHEIDEDARVLLANCPQEGPGLLLLFLAASLSGECSELERLWDEHGPTLLSNEFLDENFVGQLEAVVMLKRGDHERAWKRALEANSEVADFYALAVVSAYLTDGRPPPQAAVEGLRKWFETLEDPAEANRFLDSALDGDAEAIGEITEELPALGETLCTEFAKGLKEGFQDLTSRPGASEPRPPE